VSLASEGVQGKEGVGGIEGHCCGSRGTKPGWETDVFGGGFFGYSLVDGTDVVGGGDCVWASVGGVDESLERL
jgi:hypothetical protein